MVSIAEDKSGKDGADSSAGGDGATGCQHYKRKCKFYVSIHPPLSADYMYESQYVHQRPIIR